MVRGSVGVGGCWVWGRFMGPSYSLQPTTTGEHLEFP